MATVKFTPTRLDVVVYGSDPWAMQMTVEGLGSLVGAAIVAKLKTGSGPSVDMTVTPVDLAAGKFSVSDVGGRGGDFDLQITPSGASPRTYVYGNIQQKKDVA